MQYIAVYDNTWTTPALFAHHIIGPHLQT